MKRILTLNLLLAAFTFMGFAQADAVVAPNASGAVIEFESKEMDYGLIENASDGQRVFNFTNTGTEDLIITTCKGSCGCTVPQCPREAFAPGESGTISVKYDTKRTGRFTKTVTVNTNAANSPVTLVIKGEVKAPVTDEMGDAGPVKKAPVSPTMQAQPGITSPK